MVVDGVDLDMTSRKDAPRGLTTRLMLAYITSLRPL